MNPALFPIATAMSRILADDVGATELQRPSAFALRPCRKESFFSRLWRRLFAAPAKTDGQARER